jgi:uncharacterized protein YggE
MAHLVSATAIAAIARAALVLPLLLAFWPGADVALAQEGDVASAGATQPTVTVTGRGTASAEPDMAAFTTGVEVMADDLASTQEESTRRMTAILDALRQAGVPDEAIQTVGFRVEVVGADAPPQPVEGAGAGAVEPAMAVAATPGPAPIQGFRVVNEVRVEVADLDRLGAILDDVVAAGANTVFGVELTVDDPSDAQRQARQRAVADARTVAEDLAMAVGGRLGNVLAITTDGVSGPPQPVAAEAQAAGAPMPIAPGQTEIAVEVRVTYALLPGAG